MSYQESYFTERESWLDWRIEARELIRLAHVNQGTRVLELGCGGGGLLRMLHERGAFAVGVDTLETALKLASESLTKHDPKRSAESIHPPLTRIGVSDSLPFSVSSFDSIIGQHVIEHLPNTSAALHEWRRLLKPTGRLMLATPNGLYPDPSHFADADHTHVFTPNELRDLVEQAGFVVESCYTIFPFLSRARLLRGVSLMTYYLFRYVHYFPMRGRTIVLVAKKN